MDMLRYPLTYIPPFDIEEDRPLPQALWLGGNMLEMAVMYGFSLREKAMFLAYITKHPEASAWTPEMGISRHQFKLLWAYETAIALQPLQHRKPSYNFILREPRITLSDTLAGVLSPTRT